MLAYGAQRHAKEVPLTEVSPLFTPFQLGKLHLSNRFVMPAMQRGMCEDGKPSAALAQYYRRRAEGGVPLIIGESAAIDHPTATRQPSSAWITRASRDAWKRCVDEVGEAGGHMLIQLWHEGAVRKDDGLSISPSCFVQPGRANGRAATLDEIAELIEAYTRSALIAQDAGAAGVEVHAAHGYFLDQFLWAGINHRDDGYGGADIAHRARFPAEMPCRLRIFLRDHRVLSLEKRDYAGFFTRPFTWEQAEAKFMRLAEPFTNPALRQALLEVVYHLETRAVHDLVELLAQVKRRSS